VSNSKGEAALSRRTFVGRVAAGAVVAVAASGVKRAAASAAQPQAGVPSDATSAAAPEAKATASAPPPWPMLQPLKEGAVVAAGWRVAALSEIQHGSCVLTLANERGRTHRIHLCRNDGRPQGLVYTREVDLVVMNGGQGDLPTEEGLAQAVAEVAHVLAANERRHAETLTALLPQSERTQLFAHSAALR
jgi:hypothetical protein